MRISDWSSDVCSSDLSQGADAVLDMRGAHAVFGHGRIDHIGAHDPQRGFLRPGQILALVAHIDGIADLSRPAVARPPDHVPGATVIAGQIGRASCRARVWQYVQNSGVAVSLKKTKKK